MRDSLLRTAVSLAALFSFSACGQSGLFGSGQYRDPGQNIVDVGDSVTTAGGSSILDLFNRNAPDVSVEVNRYLWNASLDVLNFMPIESVDPFTGVIVFGFGNPPGGGQAYRGTVHIKDPALDARSLTLSLQTRSGPVAAGTQRAVEDAILSRARQLRIADGKR